MILKDLLAALETIAPLRYAEPWDNVGLIAGDPSAPVSRALLTIDYTPAVADEARKYGAELVVSYHPPLFEAIKRIRHDSPVFRAIRDGVALYSPHTALDVAPGGTNDMLADALGVVERAPLRLSPLKDTHYKLVTFAPEEEVDHVASALFAAGAGHIGKYSSCSFRSPGTGTFLGEEGTNPTVGEAGRLERAPEIRIETVLPIHRIEAAVRALREAHSYEEPAFDLVRLAAPPEATGIGRIGELAVPTSRSDLLDRVKKALAVHALLVAGPLDGDVKRVAVCAGAGRSLLDDAIAKRAELYLTGEIPHHDALRAANAGMTVVCALHSNSERAALRQLADKLGKAAPGLEVRVSEADRDPFVIR